jgi:hypothetical protein
MDVSLQLIVDQPKEMKNNIKGKICASQGKLECNTRSTQDKISIDMSAI